MGFTLCGLHPSCLAVEIQQATQRMTQDLCPDLNVSLRTGDTSQSERAKTKGKPSFSLRLI